MRRIFSFALVLLIVFCGSRALIRALPGDPIQVLLAETATSMTGDVLREELHLDEPYFRALAFDLRRAANGDFGKSILTREEVGPLVLDHFGNTALLAVTAMALGLFVAILLGLLAAKDPYRNPGRLADRICTFHGALMAALPTPWIGPILIYLLAVMVPLFPVSGSLALPVLTLSLGFSGFWARLIRQRVRESLLLPAAAAARARGLSESRVLLKYGLAPVSGPLLAYLGTQFGFLLGGAFVTEVIFDWPGIGGLLVDAVLRRDYPVVEASIFVAAAASLCGNALGDLGQYLLSPKERTS